MIAEQYELSKIVKKKSKICLHSLYKSRKDIKRTWNSFS